MQNSKLLKIDLGPTPTAHEVGAIDKTKPAIFIFEGDGSFDKDYNCRKDNQYLAKIASELKANADINLYTIQSDYYLGHGLIIRDYNRDPQSFITPVIRELVNEIILKDTPNITSLKDTARQAAIAAVKTTLSRQLAIGYSIGGEIIQEMTNAINQTLKDKGFTIPETKDCVEHFSAGTIGNPALLKKKPANASQLHTLLAEDKTVFARSEGKNHLTLNDPHPHAYLNYETYGANNLAMVSTLLSHPEDDGHQTYATKLERRRGIRSTDEPGPEEAHPAIPATIANPIRISGQTPQPVWTSKMVRRDTDGHHDLYLNTNIDRLARLDLQTYGFNPGANIFWEGMKRLVENAQIGYGSEDYHPPAAIVKQMRTEFLSREGKQKIMQTLRNTMETYKADAEWVNNQPTIGR